LFLKSKKDFVDMYSLNASYAGDYHSFGPLFWIHKTHFWFQWLKD